MFLPVLFVIHSGFFALYVEANQCGGLQGVYVCNPLNPAHFDICIGDEKYTLKCPTELHFNSVTQVCDWPKNSDCGRSDIPSPSQDMPRYKQVYTNPYRSPLRQDRSDNVIRSRHVEDLNPTQAIGRPRYSVNDNGRNMLKRNGNDFRRTPKLSRNENRYFHRNAQSPRHREDSLRTSQQKSNRKYRKVQDGYVYSNKNRAQKNRLRNPKRLRNDSPTSRNPRQRSSDIQKDYVHTAANSSRNSGFRSDSRHSHSGTKNSYRYSPLNTQGTSRRFGLYDSIESHAGIANPKSARARHLSSGTKSITAAAAGRRQSSRQQRKPVSSAAGRRHGSRQSQSLRKSITAAAAGKPPSPRQQSNSFVKSISAAAVAAPQRQPKPRKTGPCSPDTCQPPDCRCVGTDIPGGLPLHSTPQMIMLTFDDSVNSANFGYYRQLFGGKFHNPNGCPIKSTFYVSGDASEYRLVDKLHKQGHEIASHSLSHRSPSTFWASAGYDGWVNEIEGMRRRLSDKSKIPVEEIRGMRAPFLQLGGDDQYQMLEDFDYLYDTSMVTGYLYKNNDHPVWPFTLDYPPDSKICSLSPCPTKSYPGLWEMPMVRWYGDNRIACAMPDSCTTGMGKRGTVDFLMDNFARHYQTNRSPLGIFLHASWFRRKDGNLQGLLDFLEIVTGKKDVWVVTVTQVIDWMKNPVPNSDMGSLPSWSCE
ncbi:hypothetical protein ACOMHN_027957 [Nucella lapillus]